MGKQATKSQRVSTTDQQTIQCYIQTKHGEKIYFNMSREQAKKVLRLQKIIRAERARQLQNVK